MSAHGRAGPGLLGWALVVIAAALIGGLAAAALVDASLVVAVVVSLVIGAIGVVVVLRSPARKPELTSPRTTTMPRARARRAAPPPESYPPDPVAPVAPPAPAATVPVPAAPGGLNRDGAPAVNETVVQLLPLTPPGTAGQADAPWWDSARGAPAPSARARRVPAPDLSTYLASTFVAQCPRCGAFRLDIRRAGSAWDFRCEVCSNTWSWQPGTPWPPVRVMPP